MSSTNLSFAFGKNWRRFVDRHLNDDATAFATQSFTELLETRDLTGQSFIDVGCGSGLFSLVAHRLGASSVTSFDVDGDSVACCRYLREREGSPATWDVRQGSILDRAFVDGLGTFDVVFSWGVLHHTGAMWEAVTNAISLVGERGRLVIAIYNRADALGVYPDGRFGPSRVWPGLKRIYCRLPSPAQYVIDSGALAVYGLTQLLTLKNPISSLRAYRKTRGMDLRIDIRDWLGGYPYEYAAIDEVFTYVRDRGFTMVNLKCHPGLRCNEYVFQRTAAP